MKTFTLTKLFHDEGRYDIETSPLICSANQWTGFYMITASVMNELNLKDTVQLSEDYVKPISCLYENIRKPPLVF